MRTDAALDVPARKRALIRGTYKLILSQPEDEMELYDLKSDRREQVDLAALQPDRVRAMRARLDAQASEAGGEAATSSTPYEPSQEEASQLEALGYVEDAD